MSTNRATTCSTGLVNLESPRYPRPAIPLMPVLSYAGFGSNAPANPSLRDVPHILTSAGRAAIALALKDAGVTRGDEVLVPAYHCESMIAPVEHVGATPVFYRVKRSTEIDLDDLESKITSKTRAVLATHYFGFPQLVCELRTLSDRHDLALIEDCAHAFFGRANGQPIGTVGDYAVGSAMKFFPLFDGGLLASARKDLSGIEQFRPSLAMELKGLVSITEHAMRYGRLRIISMPLRVAVALKNFAWGAIKKIMPSALGSNISPPSSEGGYTLDPKWIHARMSRLSEFILSHSKIDRICDGRRANYKRILDALDGTPNMAPLFPALPDDTVPLVVPMIVENPEVLFPKLKSLGVPIWRFGEYLYPQITDHVCENSVYLSKHIFQFPCHPDMTDEEIEWMVTIVRDNAILCTTQDCA